MLSTGTPTATQGISLVSSVLSLSWGASRTFMMLRPSDKADADPELITVSLRIWPYVLEQFRSKSINIEILTLVTFVFCPIDWLMLLGFSNCLMTNTRKNCDRTQKGDLLDLHVAKVKISRWQGHIIFKCSKTPTLFNTFCVTTCPSYVSLQRRWSQNIKLWMSLPLI